LVSRTYFGTSGASGDLQATQGSYAGENLLAESDQVQRQLDGIPLGGGSQDRFGLAQGGWIEPELFPDLTFSAGRPVTGSSPVGAVHCGILIRIRTNLRHCTYDSKEQGRVGRYRFLLGRSLLAFVVLAFESQGVTPVLPKRQVKNGVVFLSHDSAALPRAPELSLEPRPLTTITGMSSDHSWFLTAGLDAFAILPNGQVAALIRLQNQIAVWSADGKLLKLIGRSGSGPGEFTRVSTLSVVSPDTLLVPDFANGRLNRITASKGFDESTSLVGKVPGDLTGLAGSLPNGDLVFTSVGLYREGDTVTRTRAAIRVLRSGGSSAQIAAIPDLELVRVLSRFRGNPRFIQAPLGFTRQAHVVVWDTLIASGSGNGFTIELREASGRQVAVLSLFGRPRRVTPQMRAAAVAADIERLNAPSTEQFIDRGESERLRRELPYSDSLPPYGRWFVSPNNTLWITDYRVPGEASWSAIAFRSDGAIVGRLKVEDGSTPVAFGDDRVLVSTEDSDGVVTLRAYRIRTRRMPQ